MRDSMEILFEDELVLVCYKPAGVATQTKAIGQEDMESLLKKYLQNKGEKPEIYVIHRLDQPVEGVMVFAKDNAAAQALSKQVAGHDFQKKYYAVTSNPKMKTNGILEDYLVKDGKSNLSKISNKGNPNAKQAKLEYKVIDNWDDRQLVDISLFTGRHHQIRVQMSNIGAPLVGDTKYGGEKTGRNLALCSYFIGFKHPKTGKDLEFRIKPKGEDFSGSSVFK